MIRRPAAGLLRGRAPVATATAIVLVAGAVPGDAAALVTVSRGDAYATCTAGGGSGIVWAGAEVEPQVAVNPADPANVITVWQQDRWSDGGARGVVAGVSDDGGRSFTEVPLPFSACAVPGSEFNRASDPWISIGPDGTAYAAAVSVRSGVSPITSAVAVATSKGGMTWDNVHMLTPEDGAGFNDKETVTADPEVPGTAYVVWNRLEGTEDGVGTGPAYFARTMNGGRTWSRPRVIVPTGPHEGTVGNLVVVGTAGGTRLYNVFQLISGVAGTRRIAVVTSEDGGGTWSAPRTVADLGAVGFTDPGTGLGVRSGAGLPAAAVDPVTGDLHVVWADGLFSGGAHDDVAIATSSDGGVTFTAPTRVNAGGRAPIMTPSVAAGGDGTVAVSYYEIGPAFGPGLPARYVLRTRAPGATAFGPEVVVHEPFDIRGAPQADGLFLGDYQGLASAGGGFMPVFVKANPGDAADPTDVVTGHFPAGSQPSASTDRARANGMVSGAAVLRRPTGTWG